MGIKTVNQILKNLFALILIVPQLVSGAEERYSNPDFGSRLANCGAFFGLLSQSKSEFSDGLKGFSAAATSYAIVAFSNPHQAEMEVGKSMVNLANDMPKLQKDKNAFKQKFEDCIATLKIGEAELRPQMDELMKSLVPEIFGGSQR